MKKYQCPICNQNKALWANLTEEDIGFRKGEHFRKYHPEYKFVYTPKEIGKNGCSYKCGTCGQRVQTFKGLVSHYTSEHPDSLNPNYYTDWDIHNKQILSVMNDGVRYSLSNIQNVLRARGVDLDISKEAFECLLNGLVEQGRLQELGTCKNRRWMLADDNLADQREAMASLNEVLPEGHRKESTEPPEVTLDSFFDGAQRWLNKIIEENLRLTQTAKMWQERAEKWQSQIIEFREKMGG